MRRLHTAAGGARVCEPAVLAATPGIRRGEVFAPRWQDCDLLTRPSHIQTGGSRPLRALLQLVSPIQGLESGRSADPGLLGITLGLYWRVMPRLQDEATQRFDAAFQWALEQQGNPANWSGLLAER